MTRYRAKPVEVEAVQWLKPGDHQAVLHDGQGGFNYIDTISGGRQLVEPGDWIIAEIDGSGQHYPCRPHIFAEKYESIEESKQPEWPAGRPAAFDDYVPEQPDQGEGVPEKMQDVEPKRGAQIGGNPNVQQPSVGRIVQFYSSKQDDGTNGKTCAAIIIGIPDDQLDDEHCVNLTVFKPYGGTVHIHAVPLRSLSKGGYCWWDWLS